MTVVQILKDVADERERQDKRWGGPRHDDTHDCLDWAVIIQNQVNHLQDDYVYHIGREGQRKHYIRIMAVALAALESLERSNKGGIPAQTAD